jgi:hypothetical protein
MNGERDLVITAYGHDQSVDKISVSAFDNSGGTGYNNTTNAQRYCDAINSLELKDNHWVNAMLITENFQYTMDSFIPLSFQVITSLDDRATQKMLREVDAIDLAKALKGAAEDIQDKIFKNMSARAAQMIKEDMEYMGPVRVAEVNESRKKITDIIRHLEQTGEIIISSQGDMIA